MSHLLALPCRPSMQKIRECDHCMFYSHDYHIVCAIHPSGIEGDSCSDFRPDSELQNKRFIDFLGLGVQQQGLDEELWQLPGVRFVNRELVIERVRSFYNGEEIVQPRQRWTSDEQLWLLDNHPLFTGVCPECGYQFSHPERSLVHWDCPVICSILNQKVYAAIFLLSICFLPSQLLLTLKAI